jgi:hypothetical protein
MNGHGAKKYQAEAFGWLAVALAPRDPARSRALIDRALAMPTTHPEEFASYDVSDRSSSVLDSGVTH